MKLGAFSLIGTLAGALFVGGCASGGGPSALTGTPVTSDSREQARWTDDKGHFHPEWQTGVNRPANYPKG